METLTRRGFLCGRLHPSHALVRPPWSLAEADFLRRCSRCNACVEVCRTDIIVCSDGGYPEVDFARGECTFCGDCTSRCRDGALRRGNDGPPWDMRAEIGGECLALKQVECRICAEQCLTGAIRFQLHVGRMASPRLAEDRCTGCGACVASCPAGAIVVRAPATAEGVITGESTA